MSEPSMALDVTVVEDYAVATELPLTTDDVSITRLQAAYKVKRVVDILVSAAFLLILSPLFAAISIAIRCSGTGQVFYRQRRVGRGGCLFTLYKFRTMVNGADGLIDEVFHLNEASGPLFKCRTDPRITPLGKALRAAFLDELPQLFNVLKGDMSLVGPRPCLPEEAARMDGDVAFRFSVPQGMTGPWQISGYHNLTFEDQLQVERRYVQCWSLRTDLEIVIKTIPLALRRAGI